MKRILLIALVAISATGCGGDDLGAPVAAQTGSGGALTDFRIDGPFDPDGTILPLRLNGGGYCKGDRAGTTERVDYVEVDETTKSVILRAFTTSDAEEARNPRGSNICFGIGGPDIQTAVELDEPVGDRVILDASHRPPTPRARIEDLPSPGYEACEGRAIELVEACAEYQTP